jgi:hypothetical protein
VPRKMLEALFSRDFQLVGQNYWARDQAMQFIFCNLTSLGYWSGRYF